MPSSQNAEPNSEEDEMSSPTATDSVTSNVKPVKINTSIAQMPISYPQHQGSMHISPEQEMTSQHQVIPNSQQQAILYTQHQGVSISPPQQTSSHTQLDTQAMVSYKDNYMNNNHSQDNAMSGLVMYDSGNIQQNFQANLPHLVSAASMPAENSISPSSHDSMVNSVTQYSHPSQTTMSSNPPAYSNSVGVVYPTQYDNNPYTAYTNANGSMTNYGAEQVLYA